MSAKSQVLVVDDEADIRELLGMTLARMGLEAHCAASTSEAYALLAKNKLTKRFECDMESLTPKKRDEDKS